MTDTHDTHDHHHDEPGGTSHSLPVVEESLDPANQSLADALRVSFRLLKFIMFGVVLVYLFSGFYKVDQNEVVIVTRLGRFAGEKKPGLNWTWPYPFSERTRVRLDAKTLEIKSFWMALSKDDELRPLTQVRAAKNSLKPGEEGALLTAAEHREAAGGAVTSEGAELVHVKWNIVYRIDADGVLDYFQNITGEEALVRSLFEAASVAMAARYTVDDIAFFSQMEFRIAVQNDAQRRLDAIKSGIRLVNVDNIPYQPLQVRDEFDAVVKAENEKRSAIQSAEQESRRILYEAAGENHAQITDAIRAFEAARQAGRPREALAELEREIDRLLTTVARGRASDVVQTAKFNSERIVQELRAAADTLRDLKPKYDQSPVLLPARLWEDTRREIFASDGVMRFLLPEGAEKNLSIWLNRDPEQLREQLNRKLQAEKK